MPSEEEILKYVIDKSQAEAQLDQLQQRLEEFKAKRAAGEDTSEIEAQINKQITGLGKLADKEQETAGATEDLVKQKDKLSSVMRVLGGQSAGMVGDLGGVIELLMSMGPAAAGAAGALAGITLATAAYQKFNEEMKEAIQLQRDHNQAVTEGKLGEMAGLTGLRDQLEALGGLDRLGDAYGMMGRLGRKHGFERERAAEVAGLGVMAGLGVEETAMLSHAMRSGGAQVETPQQAQQLVDMLKADQEAYGRAQANLSTITKSPPGMLAQAKAEQYGVGTPELRAAERVWEALGDKGKLPEGVKSVDDLMALIQGGDELRAKVMTRRAAEEADLLRAGQGGGVSLLASRIFNWWRGESTGALEQRFRATERANRLYEREMLREGGGMSAAVDPDWQPTPSDGARPVQSVVNNYNNIRVGSITNTADRKTRGWNPTWGVTPGDGSTIRTKHGMEGVPS